MKKVLLSSVMFLSLPGAASAAIALVPDRISLGANDFVSWGQFGGPFSNVPAPFVAASNLGNTATGIPSVLRYDQSPVGWNGNFNNGDQLLYNLLGGFGSQLTLDFGDPVSRVGFNIQADDFVPFVGHLEAFDINNVSLGIFSVNGNSNSNADGSAVFLGISNDVANIKSILISSTLPNGPNTGYAINEVALSTEVVEPPAIPEPNSILVLSGLLAGGCLTRLRKRI